MPESELKSLRPLVSQSKPRIPRSFKDLTPTRAFHPTKFFREMILKSLLTPRKGGHKNPKLPKLKGNKLAITWIGHAAFLIQFVDLNVLIDPNFANWLFLLKRVKRAGLRPEHLPEIDLLLLTHAHFDHFHKRSIKRLPYKPKIAVMPLGMGELAHGLGIKRIVELDWWETFTHKDCQVTLTPAKHWGARTLHDHYRGYGGFVLQYRSRSVYHAGDTAYFEGFSQIGRILRPEIAILPIGAYEPNAFKKVHMCPEDALKAFKDLKAKWLIPMHFGAFKLSFEDPEEPPQRLIEAAKQRRILNRIIILEEGVPLQL